MRLQVKSKTWLEANGKFIIGEAGTALLEAVDDLGSIQQGASRLGWSYRPTLGGGISRTWSATRACDLCLPVRLANRKSCDRGD